MASALTNADTQQQNESAGAKIQFKRYRSDQWKLKSVLDAVDLISGN